MCTQEENTQRTYEQQRLSFQLCILYEIEIKKDRFGWHSFALNMLCKTLLRVDPHYKKFSGTFAQ